MSNSKTVYYCGVCESKYKTPTKCCGFYTEETTEEKIKKEQDRYHDTMNSLNYGSCWSNPFEPDN